MKYFLAYRGSGEDESELITRLENVAGAFHDAGHELYATHLDTATADKAHKVKDAFRKINESEGLIVLVNSPEPSEGMPLEIGYAYGIRPIYMLVKEGIEPKALELADRVIRWQEETELPDLIKENFS